MADGRTGARASMKTVVGQNQMANGSWSETIETKLQLFASRLKNPEPALQEVEILFSMMEREIFANNGNAPSFGYSHNWAGFSENSKGNKTGKVMINYGYLKASAENPVIKITNKTLIADIDPRHYGAGTTKKSYSRGRNYGVYHQTGTNNMPARPIVPEVPPPIFLEACRNIVYRYMADDIQVVDPESKNATAQTLATKATNKTKRSKKSGYNYKTNHTRKPIKKRASVDGDKPKASGRSAVKSTQSRSTKTTKKS
jgi:hypothetical protein